MQECSLLQPCEEAQRSCQGEELGPSAIIFLKVVFISRLSPVLCAQKEFVRSLALFW